MKILVFGAKGYLGSQFTDLYEGAVGSTADIGDREALAKELDEHKPDVVINAAGKTGRPNIDWCEEHKEETLYSNVTAPLILLEECKKQEVQFVHIGSGCIYQGDNGGSGFTEEDPPNYSGSFYSKTKLWIDQILQEFPVLNIRLRMPFDGTNEPRSLITKIAQYSRLIDTQNSITYLPDFFAAVHQLIEKQATGTYNIVNPGSTSPYDIIEKYKEIVDSTIAFERLSLQDLSEVAKAGRSNCLLSIAKLEGEGITMRPVDDALTEALQNLAKTT